mmetsp:Transcript_24353/g.34069  ORF Transcript_24353/g.34069 Transcript_24353/m.34069 type:complete len:117 (-) Transcript_24353:378-728(-)
MYPPTHLDVSPNISRCIPPPSTSKNSLKLLLDIRISIILLLVLYGKVFLRFIGKIFHVVVVVMRACVIFGDTEDDEDGRQAALDALGVVGDKLYDRGYVVLPVSPREQEVEDEHRQ